ncbi:MAG TPA: CHAD domain-containing protein [Terracidiphilus sp.]|nr:CHAD domain-containing protein [Terracidiphilus sp.]
MPLDPQRATKPLRKAHKALGHPARSLTPEGVHALRTQCYRIKSILRAFALDEERDGAQLLRAIEPVRKRAGKVRDADVLTGLAASLSEGSGSESLIQVMEDLGVRHERFADKLEKTLYAERREARRRLKTFMKWMKGELTAPNSEAADSWRRYAVARAIDLSSELDEWPALHAENLHPFRLKVKELRYVLQLSSDSDHRVIDALGEVKDAIGEWHDWSELEAVVVKVLEDKGRSPLSKQIAAVVRSKLKHALTLATRLRRNYFDAAQARHNTRTMRRATIKAPVLEAAARMAA